MFLSYENMIQMDMEGAYLCIHCSESASNLSHFLWFEDPIKNGDKNIIVLKCTRCQFGVPDSGELLQLGVRKYVGTEAEGYVKVLITRKSYVDNYISVEPNGCKLGANIIASNMQSLFNKYNLNLFERVEAKDQYPEEESQCLFGLKWRITSDTVTPQINLNINKTVKGVRQGRDISEEEVDWRTLTERQLKRVTSQ